MYKINDIVVYRRDVCKIIAKEKSDFTGEMCYILVPYMEENSSTRIQVPVSNKAGHLRSLITKEDIQQLIKDAPDMPLLVNKPANMKSQYTSILKEDNVADLIRIIKTSYLRNRTRMEQHKKLASVDEEYLRKAETYLYNEIAAVMDMTYEEAKEYFESEVEKLQAE